MIIFLKMNNYNLYTYKSDFIFLVSEKGANHLQTSHLMKPAW